MADSKRSTRRSRGCVIWSAGCGRRWDCWTIRPRTWRDVWRAVAPEALDDRCRPSLGTPTTTGRRRWIASGGRLKPLVEALRAGLAAAGVRLVAVRSRAIFAEEFNDLVERHGSKGAALSHQTLALAARMIDPLPAGPISVICDKHGGRNRYGPLLAAHFPEWLIEVRGEGRQRSVYRFGPPERRVEVCFRTQAESCLPAALASMASKYLRELAMRALNDYWRRPCRGCSPRPDTRKTPSGFAPTSPRRKQSLHIADRVLWRDE